MKRTLVASLAALSLLAAGTASAQFAKPEDAIKYRQSALTVMGNHFGRIGAMVNNRIPFDAKVAAENAAVVVTMSKLPWVAFGPGTDAGLPTRAKPEIWREQDKFKAASDKMVADVAALDTAAKTGNLDQIKAAFGTVGQSCKACHDAYRAER